MGKLAKNYKVYAVEEKHRGKWQPLIAENDKPKQITITEETAEVMNIDSEAEGIRYVLAKGSAKSEPVKDENEQTDLDVIKERYEAVVGKKPYHKWDIDTLKEKIAEAQADA
jgi:hypothetical protein